MGAFLEGVFGSKQGTAAALQSAADLLVSLSGMLEPDGGMPGEKPEMRVVNSLAALLSFYKHGNTSTSGTFRMHVEKLLQFLRPEQLKRLKTREESAARRLWELIEAGRPVPGSWEQFVVTIVKGKRFEVSDFWTEVESALAPDASATVARE